MDFITEVLLTKETIGTTIGAIIGTICPLIFISIKSYLKDKKVDNFNNTYCLEILNKLFSDIRDINKETNRTDSLFGEYTAGKIKLLYSNIKNHSIYFQLCKNQNIKDEFMKIYINTPDIVFPIGDYINYNQGVDYGKLKEYYKQNFSGLNFPKIKDNNLYIGPNFRKQAVTTN
ncbi:MAG: hypothetical protein K2X69_01610 [Silvanigrellaceae bacterium]|nr:hypothetical protein [Silvanigrellaceae bacterium]